MKILVTGATGTVGKELCKHLKNVAKLLTPSHQELDITKYPQIMDYFNKNKAIDLLINCAAFTDIEQAQKDHGRAFQVNADGPALLAEKCKKLNIPMIHFSSYGVFDGTHNTTYAENHSPGPLHVYGHSKLKGDDTLLNCKARVTIFRLGPVYDLDENGLFAIIVKAFLDCRTTQIDNYQVIAPTYVGDIAKAITRIISEHPKLDWVPGLYHLSAEGETTYHEFAKQIHECLGLQVELLSKKPFTVQDKDLKPQWCLLNTGKFQREFGFRLHPWDRTLNLRFDEFFDSISKA